MKKTLLGAVLGVALLCSSGAIAPAGAAEKVVIGELNWQGAVIIQHILAEVIRTRFNGEVSFLAGDPAVLWAGLDKGDGSVDVYTDAWLPNQAPAWSKFVAPGGRESVIANKHPYTGIQGLFIPGYIQDQYGVRSVEDLKRPEIAKLFAPPGGGKPELLVGPPGWASTNIGLVKAKSYGYDSLFEPVLAEAAVTYAKLDAAYKEKRGVVFYAYTPDWIFSAYDLRELKEPPFDGYAQDSKKDNPQYKADGCWKFISPTEDPDWLSKSHITCAYPDAKVYVTYAKTLRERAPKSAKFLENVAIDPTVINNLLLEIERDKLTPEQVATKWVAANQSIVDQWIDESK
jgi:glycine betaine/proline transport system substrate-binding protein